ncbi:MAG: GGDEF domain-containing protein [Burkholderiales bacterium PBB3]|nr:MAG: GGDEF domain-containing protein [Burkholderiales bacterium PBB3]
MLLFADDTQVQALEQQLDAAEALRPADTVLALAWHLRQRAPQRALALADELDRAHAASHTAHPVDAAQKRAMARLQLVRAEIAWLHGQLDAAHAGLAQAQAWFADLNDWVGMGDTHWAQAYVMADLGDTPQWMDQADRAVAAYTAAQDPTRLQLGIARQVAIYAFVDTARAQALLDAHGLRDSSQHTPAVAVWIDYTLGVLYQSSSDLTLATSHYERAYRAGLLTGQIRMAALAAGNLSNSLVELNNLTLALDWAERGLTLARDAGLPILTGNSLLRTGSVLAQLEHHNAARVQLREALRLLAPIKESRSYAMVLRELGEVCLGHQENSEALDWFIQAQQRCAALGAKEVLAESLRGRAQALLQLGRGSEALAVATDGLALCREHGYRANLIVLLQILATLHGRFNLPAPAGLSAGTASLHYLNEALQVATTLHGYTVPGTLLEQAAAEHAKLGDLAEAYQLALQAGVSRERIKTKEASNRAMTLQVRHETERAQAEAAYNKKLAVAEAKRGDALHQANTTLEDLAVIGLEIMGSLNAQDVLDALNHHVHKLLDSTTFGILLLEPDGKTLVTVLNMEDGKELPEERYSLDDPHTNLARCARERREINMALEPGMVHATQLPGTLLTLSALYAPMLVGARLFGAITVQSPKPHAYGERETAIFRTLCAYGSIALANGVAFEAAEQARRTAEQAQGQATELLAELRQAQTLLMEKNQELEHLSATDSLTGLSNRLRLDRALEHDLARCARKPFPLSIIMLDVDRFKPINDTHGHQVGDSVLVAVARVLESNIRKSDLLGRWGGEEFLLVCSGTLDDAIALAEKLRLALQRQSVPRVGTVTASFGVSAYRVGDTSQTLIGRADAALYVAKATGRNQVSVEI